LAALPYGKAVKDREAGKQQDGSDLKSRDGFAWHNKHSGLAVTKRVDYYLYLSQIIILRFFGIYLNNFSMALP
jgi:hypothetical protein